MIDPVRPTVVARFPEADEARAAQLVALLEAQGIEAFSLFEIEAAPGGPAAHTVLLPEGEQAARAVEIAAAFRAEYPSALDYMDAHGIVPEAPVRGGCGLFWLFPALFFGMGALQLVGVGTGSRAVGAGLLTLGVLMGAASWWIAAQGPSDADDVER